MNRRAADFPDNGFEAWGGYMQAKKAKLEEQFSKRTENEEKSLSNIFNGISIFVNGYTNPSADELKTLMAKHGGIYHTYQRSDDFIIASNLPDTKVKKMSLSKVVRPEWITESISSNRLLDYRHYLLYNSSRSQPKIAFDSVNLSNRTSISTLETIKAEEKGSVVITVPSSHNDKPESYTKTAADPNFIAEFYNNSRLHHISQLGACFKQHVNDLRENSNFEFPARISLKKDLLTSRRPNSPNHFQNQKVIMHIDMDCFFVSVGLRKRPEMRGKPIAVTHSKGGQPRTKRDGVDRNTEFNLYINKQAQKLSKATGAEISSETIETRVSNIGDEDDKYGSMSEIASCSYEARAKGIKNGMFMGAALRLCPDLQTIPYDFEEYKEVAYTLYNTVARYTLDIEAVSCDEMYVDCTELLKSLDISAQDFASALRDEIKSKTGCPCSTGFGGNRLQARLATKQAKPDGQFFLFSELVQDYMFDVQLSDLPGVGRQTCQKLEMLGHKTCGSLQNVTLVTLQRQLGNKTGAQLFDQCRGIDNNPLNFYTVRKSVSAEVNYGIRFENVEHCHEFLRQLSHEVQSRLTKFKVVGKCITLKLMVRAENAPVETAKFMGHGFCDVINKSINLNTATSDAEVIFREVVSICKKLKVEPKEMRGIGIQVTKLQSTFIKETKGAINKFLSVTAKPNAKNMSGNSTGNTPEDILSGERNQEFGKQVKLNLPVTPEKSQRMVSPSKNKSPVLIKKSPVKRRGRPLKNISFKTPSNSKQLISNFFVAPIRHTAIDIEEKKQIASTSNYAVKKDNFTVKEPDKSGGFLSLSWEKVRELLRAWLNSGQAPLECDVNLISTYMRELVINKQIDKLKTLLNFLGRRVHEMDCKTWIKVNKQIIEQVQAAMVAVYGKELYIDW